MPALTFLEAIEDDARCNYQFDMTGGSGRAFYHTPVDSSYPIQYFVQNVIGYTNPNIRPATPALSRLLPVTHPKCPYLYAARLVSLIGKGSGTAVKQVPDPPPNPDIGYNPITDFFFYKQYEVGVEFASRPYPLIADSSFVQTATNTWVPRNGGAAETFTYATEWARYTDYDYLPQDNTIQGQTGSLSLWKDGATGVTFTSPPWMWLPDQILKIKWYQVPYRFITSPNSYIAGTGKAPDANGGGARNWRGRVNQNAWWNWPAGSLLYMGYSVTKYTPPTLDIGTYPSITSVGTAAPTVLGNLINYERLCDIELTFLYTNRFRSGSLGAPITNGNYIPEGHNLLPNLSDGKFYYATRNPAATGTQSVQNPPPWFSFPVEVLFSDPDVAGGPSTTNDN